MGSRHRIVGLARVAVARVVGRATGGRSRQLVSSVLGVALAIALMTTVSGIALGLASQSAIQSEDVDYWVVPEGSSASSIAVSVGGPKLGDTHDAAARLRADERVDYATPVLLRVLRVENADSGTTEYVLGVGVVSDGADRDVMGVSTASLTPGDPHYDGGGYNGTWTGEVVLSDAGAELLNASEGDSLAPADERAGDRRFAVTTVAEGDYATGTGPLPIAVFQLSELQSVSGTADADQADQILVSTNAPGVREDIETLYPHTTVVERTGVSSQQLSSSNLPLAVALTALLAALTIGTLFVATMMGLELNASRESLAVLAAVGFSQRARAFVLIVETITVAIVGALAGILLGFGGIELVNALSNRYLGVSETAVFHPGLIAYGLCVAVVIGLLASIYPVVLSRRTSPLDALR